MKLLDWIGKWISQVKTIAIVVLIICFSVSFIQNGCQGDDINILVERVTGLNIDNDVLKKRTRAQDSLIWLKEKQILNLEYLARAQADSNKVLKVENSSLQASYDALAEKVLKTPPDTSYAFLDKHAYPFPGEKKYPFNEMQVQGMHLTFLQNKGLNEINSNLKEQVDGCEALVAIQDETLAQIEEKNTIVNARQATMMERLDNREEVIQVQQEQIKKDKRRKIWRTVRDVSVGILFGLLL